MLKVRPITYRQACAYITEHHRHHKQPRGGKVFLSVVDADSVLRGVAVIGRPSARAYDALGTVAEIVRTCTDGTPNANSALYGACRRVAKAMGYARIITYTQEGESGASLRAAGFVIEAVLPARGSWAESSQKLKALRDPVGSGGVGRLRWGVTFDAA